MKLLTNREFRKINEEINCLKEENSRLRKEYMDAHDRYLCELNDLYEIKETELLASKYDYIICVKDYHASIYIDGKKEKKVRAAHFEVNAGEVPEFTITR